ncbi:MAG TPA: outer membrane protein assembly factor BamE [Rhizomicrobium sp.]|jgi:outer membrane protein assembly factor BamE (lipoprotein component of BamABCDE complex)|nr:outer membrane protein assembly factor BamE [Rhizomicrobium sp.]
MKIPALALASILLIGCTPVVSQRGYLADPVGEASIKVGTDTKTTIQARLGDPSTSATFNGDTWYYISSTERQVAFFDPIVLKRAVMAITFDKDGKVAGLKHYGLKDGHIVAFETRTTPAPGRTLTFLQQIFNSTPGVPLSSGGGANNPGGQPVPGGGHGSGPGGY